MALTKVTYSMIQGAPVNVADYGAVGDGITDDTAAIQAALDSGAPYIIAEAGKTYLVSYTGTTGNNNLRYCLRMYSGQTIDFQGSTLYRANGAQAVVLTHEWEYGNPTYTIVDVNMTLKNVVVDGNKANNSYYNAGNTAANCGIYFAYTDNLFVDNVKVSNCHLSGFKVVYARFSHMNNISAFDCTGQGWGIDYYEDSFADNLYAEGTTADPITTQANSGILSGKRSSFGKIQYKNCDWGLKVQSIDTTEDIHIESIIGNGSGVKIQSNSYTYPVQRLVIDSIIIKDANDRGGLYFFKCLGAKIGTYIGYNNGLTTGVTASQYDCELLGSINIDFDTFQSWNPVVGSLYVYGPTASGYSEPVYRINKMFMRNVGATAGSGTGIVQKEGNGHINYIYHNDGRDDGTYYTYNLIAWLPTAATAANQGLTIDTFETSFSAGKTPSYTVPTTSSYLFNGSAPDGLKGRFVINKAYFGQYPTDASSGGTNPGSSSTTGYVTLNDAGADTFVYNNNCAVQGGSGWYMRPQVSLTARNANGAGMVTSMYVEPSTWNGINSGSQNAGFTIKHSSAAPTNSRISYNIGPWEVTSV